MVYLTLLPLPHMRIPCSRTDENCRTGIIAMILCFALGIANIFHLHWVILFSVLCLYVFSAARTGH